MAKNDGGPAFPNAGEPMEYVKGIDPNSAPMRISGYPHSDGMTLRDYFAAKAMAAIVSATAEPEIIAASIFARDAYELADAMLAERAK